MVVPVGDPVAVAVGMPVLGAVSVPAVVWAVAVASTAVAAVRVVSMTADDGGVAVTV